MKNMQKDRGFWPWTVVMCSFIIQVIIYGTIWTVGIWVSVFIEEFNATAAKISLIGSLLNAVTYLGGLISSLLIFKYSCRTIVCMGGVLACFGLCMSSLVPCVELLYLTFSIICGLGLGFAFTPSVVIICDYFEEKRALALGIASSGAGFGSFIFPFINHSLLDALTWRTVIFINGIIVAFIVVMGCFMRPFQDELSSIKCSESVETIEGECLKNFLTESKRALSLFKIPSYVALCLNNFLMLFGYTMIIVHNVEFYNTLVFLDSYQISFLVSIFGISNLIGRLSFGVISYYARTNILAIYCACNLLQGISVFAMPVTNNFISLVICSGLFGFHSACMGPLVPEVTIRIVGPNNISIGYGFLLLFEGLGAMISPPLAGGIYDKTSRYDISFYLGGAFLLGAGLLLGVTHYVAEVYTRRRKDKKDSDKPPPEASLDNC